MSARPDFGDYRQGRKKPRDAVSASGAAANDRGAAADHESLPLADQAISLALAARTLRDAMKDRSYQQTPIGVMVRRYIRWMRNEWGATPMTIRDYEAILARMSLVLADKQQLADVDTEDLRDVIDLWAARSPRTRQKVTSVIRAFWAWAEEQGHIALSPAARIRRPKAERKVARVLAADARPRLLEATRVPRDRVGLYCLLGLGLRRDELAGVQVSDLDVGHGLLTVMGKGRKERQLPLLGLLLDELGLYLQADLPLLGRPPQPDDYLLYPVRHVADGKGPEGQMLWRHIPEPKRRPSAQSVHRWWYRVLWDAGIVPRGQTAGMNMHRARHLFAIELRRAAGIDAASQGLGHSDLSTTLGIYGHRDDTDLRAAFEALEALRGEHEDDPE
jgi:site-specific recombinase XerD